MDLYQSLLRTGYPVAYSHFESAVKTPFICYTYEYSNNMFADGEVYQKINHYQIELYALSKNKSEAERKLMNALALFSFQKTGEEYISSQKVYQMIYETEEIINV